MQLEAIIIIFLLSLPGLLVIFEFFYFLFKGKSFNKALFRIVEIIYIVIYPSLFTIVELHTANDCCSGGSIFSPEHRLSIYCLICLCIITYFYSSYRKKIAPPIIEVLTNCILIIGLILNIFVIIQLNTPESAPFHLLGNIPIIILFIQALINTQKMLIKHVENLERYSTNFIERIAWKVLQLRPLQKFPILVVLCLPILVLITALLLLFGQRPDAMVRAFTHTYKQGLSKFDCETVDCPDQHFLCTIAAKGHNKFVKPVRMGIRHGYQIKVNRQLLVSNAFEELLEEKLPFLHKLIRIVYNAVGSNCKKIYEVLGNKWVSDIIYILMKPLEWFFILVLYTFEKQPENKIAKQYLSKSDRYQLKNINTKSQV